MMPVPKMLALAGVVGAAIGDGALYIVAAMQATTPPTAGDIGAAGITGAATSVAVLWFWKGMTDKRLDKIEADKADKSSLDDMSEMLKEMRGDIKTLMMRGPDLR